MDIKIVSATLFLLVLLYFYLSAKVALFRYKYRIEHGHDNTPKFKKSVRAQANFGEYTPLILLELFILSTLNANSMLLGILSCMIIIGRIFHAYGLITLELRNPAVYWGRSAGIMLTFVCMIGSAISILFYAF